MKRNADELLALIFSYVTKIAAIHDHARLLPELAEMGRDIVSADRCSVWVLDRERKYLWTKVAHGVDYIKIPADSGIVGNAISVKRAMIINDVYADPHFNSGVDKKTGYKTETMMVIPMHNSKDEVIGAMQVINKKDEEGFSEDDLRHLSLASTYVAESVESSLLLEEIDATQRELVYIMGVTGESRSKETGNHVKRVAEYSRLLAELSGLSEEECNILKDASPMHDLGKIAIPDAVLNKPGRFDEEERRMKRRGALWIPTLNWVTTY
jgi:putative methionine-R-sulfoxide reductase with GAF domain